MDSYNPRRVFRSSYGDGALKTSFWCTSSFMRLLCILPSAAVAPVNTEKKNRIWKRRVIMLWKRSGNVSIDRGRQRSSLISFDFLSKISEEKENRLARQTIKFAQASIFSRGTSPSGSLSTVRLRQEGDGGTKFSYLRVSVYIHHHWQLNSSCFIR